MNNQKGGNVVREVNRKQEGQRKAINKVENLWGDEN